MMCNGSDDDWISPEELRAYAPWCNPFGTDNKAKPRNERHCIKLLNSALRRAGCNECFSDITSRGQDEQPPDCEAIDVNGRRVGIEVRELVHQAAMDGDETWQDEPAERRKQLRRQRKELMKSGSKYFRDPGNLDPDYTDSAKVAFAANLFGGMPFEVDAVVKAITGIILEKDEKLAKKIGEVETGQARSCDEYILLICCADFKYLEAGGDILEVLRQECFDPAQLIGRVYFLDAEKERAIQLQLKQA